MSEKSEQTIADMFFELRDSWNVGGENYNFVLELVQAAYDKGLQDGTQKEHRRIFIDLANYVKMKTKPDPEPNPQQKAIDKTLLLNLVKTAFERGKDNPDVHTGYLFGWSDIEAMTGELLNE